MLLASSAVARRGSASAASSRSSCPRRVTRDRPGSLAAGLAFDITALSILTIVGVAALIAGRRN